MKAEQLRKSILQLAIQGKLVPQDPNDEPASVLLERIREEKQKLIKEGKIKKDKVDSIIFKGEDNCYYEKIGNEVKDITEKIPFEIPDSWKWVRLNTIINIVSAKRVHQSEWKSAGIPFYRAREIAKLSMEDFVNNELFISEELFDNYKSFGIPQTGDLMVTAVGTIGKSYIVKETDKFYYKDASVLCFENRFNLNSKWLKLLMDSPYMVEQIKYASAGTTVDTITIVKAKNYLIPLPPLTEQTRLVKEIEMFNPLLFEYDHIEQQISELDGEIYNNLKKSILQHAIQGKIVPQDPSDEPANVLLERIRSEKKAKLGKKYVESYIYKGDDNCYYEKIGPEVKNITEEIPFEIPENWAWSRLNAFIDFSKNETVKATSIQEDDWVLDLEDIEKDNGKILCKKHMRDVLSKSDKHKFEAGNVLYSKLRPYLNKVIVADENGYCTTEILVFDFGQQILNRYAQIYLMSPFFVGYAMIGAYGVKMPRIGSERGNQALIPVPPYNEQVRIINGYNAYISIIDKGEI